MASKETKSVEMLVRDKKIYQIVNPKLVQAPPETSVREAVNLMHQNKSGYLVLSKNHKVVGVVSEDDILFKVLDKNVDWSKPVKDFMTTNWASLKMTDTVGQAIDLMGELHLYYIPLINDEGQLVNVLSVRTLIKFLAEFYPQEVYNLPPKFGQVMDTAEGG